jgi:secreted trypsin-like serine protease
LFIFFFHFSLLQLKPVCLPTDPKETFARQLGVAAGWGITEDGQSSDVLRQVELNIVPNVTCVANLEMLGLSVGPDMICTFKGPVGTESICSGDSGGPLMVR